MIILKAFKYSTCRFSKAARLVDFQFIYRVPRVRDIMRSAAYTMLDRATSNLEVVPSSSICNTPSIMLKLRGGRIATSPHLSVGIME